MDPEKYVITTQALLAIEVANQAVLRHDQSAPSAHDLQDSTCKLRAHYASARGLKPFDVTLDLLRQRHALHRQTPKPPQA